MLNVKLPLSVRVLPCGYERNTAEVMADLEAGANLIWEGHIQSFHRIETCPEIPRLYHLRRFSADFKQPF